jgi:hypothetical protein
MAYKIINLSTGRCYNHNLPNFEHNLPEVKFNLKVDAEMMLVSILMICEKLVNHHVRPEHLEIIKVTNDA